MMEKIDSLPRPLDALKQHRMFLDAIRPKIIMLRGDQISGRHSEMKPFPKWCYFPSSALEHLLHHKFHLPKSQDTFNLSIRLNALQSWSLTRGIYRFDADVLQKLLQSNLNGEIPASMFDRLPEWCVYIDVRRAGMTMLDFQVEGFYAFLDTPSAVPGKDGWLRQLYFLVDIEGLPLYPLMIELKGTVEESLNHIMDNAMKNMEKGGASDLARHHREHKDEVFKKAIPFFKSCCNILLWLCSEQPDIQGKYCKPERPQPVKTKQGMKEFPVPQQVREWDVAVRFGSVIRLAEERQERETPEASARKGEKGREVVQIPK